MRQGEGTRGGLVFIPLGDPNMEHVWKGRGLCVAAPEAYFPMDPIEPEANITPADNVYDRARVVCGSCAVALNCLTYAVKKNENTGMWAGTTPSERNELRTLSGDLDTDKIRRKVAAMQERASSLPKILALGDEYVVTTAGPKSRVFVDAAARLAGRRLEVHDNQMVAPNTVLNIARFVVRDGVEPRSFRKQYDEVFGRGSSPKVDKIKGWAARIQASVALLDPEVREKVLDTIPDNELIGLDVNDPRYKEGVCQALRMRAITQNVGVDIPRTLRLFQGLGGPKELRNWANNSQMTLPDAKESVESMRFRFVQLPPELKERIASNYPIYYRKAS